MAGYKAHSLAGLIAAVLVLLVLSFIGYVLSVRSVLLGVSSSLFGALFPDVDIKSKGQKLLYALLAAVIIILYSVACYKQAALLAVFCFLPLIVNHRAMFHSFWFIFVVTVALVLTTICWFPVHRFSLIIVAVFFLAGVFSHLVLDFGLRKTLRNRW